MSRIHPAADHIKRSKRHVYDDNHKDNCCLPPPAPGCIISTRPAIFTVWKKSSISFQGTDGFTVFDKLGQLAFRVDNYSRRKNRSIAGRGRSGGLLLMDAHGKPLLTLRPQMRSMQLQYKWNGYSGGEEDDDGSTRNNLRSPPLFVMSRPPSSLIMTMRSTSCKAQVFLAGDRMLDYRVEGSFRRRNCNITNSAGHIVANISRKVTNAITTRTTILISDDVFSLVVQPGFEPHIFMAFVIILDRMYPDSYTPILCS